MYVYDLQFNHNHSILGISCLAELHFTILCQDDRFTLEPVWRLLSLIEMQQEETIFDAMEFIKFTWNHPGCYIYHKSKVVCA